MSHEDPGASAIADTPQTVLSTHMLLENVSWDTYVALSNDSPNVRMTYSGGKLELMSPDIEHDFSSWTFDLLLGVLGEECHIPIRGSGSTTYRHVLSKQGLEPDCSYYIRNAAALRGVHKVEHGKTPPPDLVIEVEITNNVLDKLAIYIKLKVRELWRFDGKKLKMFRLQRGAYVQIKESLSFPGFDLENVLPEMIQKAEQADDPMDAVREFRAWVRAELAKRTSKK